MTTNPEYKKVSTFTEIYEDINKLTETPCYNLVYKFEISVENLQRIEFDDAFEDAKLWQNEIRPECLYFNYKEFYGQAGIDHIKNELLYKPHSKRALISLIAQDKINGSEDSPIPSFMIAQYNLAKEFLYSTFYYRGLETSGFLKINLEEFRMLAQDILESNATHVKAVRGTIIAFNAYQELGFANLKKNTLDYIGAPKLYRLLKKPGKELCDILDELKKPSSVIKTEGIREIIKWIKENNVSKKEKGEELISEKIATPRMEQNFSTLADEFDRLSNLISKSATQSQTEAIRKNIEKIIDEIKKEIKN